MSASRTASSQVPRIGIIGVGAMGLAMAQNLHAKGYPVWARDVRADADRQAREAGLTVATSARSLAAKTTLVVVVVVNAQQVEEVLFGPEGIVHAGRGARTVMLCSTVAPQDTVSFAQRLALRGISTIDAPISGGPARARAGTISVMIAASTSTVARFQPVLADLADKRFFLGEKIGDAAKAKLVNNLLAGVNLVAGAEALALSTKVGLDAQAMFEIICASSGASWMFQDRMARALTEDYSPALAAAHILTKDVALATALATSVEHQTPLADAALVRLRETVARGWSDLDDAAVIKTYQG